MKEDIQKQPPQVFCKKRCSQKFRKFHRKKPVMESLFSKVTGLQACDFIKKRLPHRYFPVKSSKCLRTPFLRTSANDCFWILLVKLLARGQQLNQKITASGSFSWEFFRKFLIVSPEAYLEPSCKIYDGAFLAINYFRDDVDVRLVSKYDSDLCRKPFIC